ncbi:MAG: SpoIID/LytB domain-containing protein [Clostridium sp.]|nr:SpoIID/LytB domain-containing protein [Clostridium sp.]
MNKRVIWAAVTGLLIPYVGTLAWTGTIRGEELRYEQQKGAPGGRRILLDRSGGSYYMDMEEYLPGVIARQMPVEYEPEALKAQAIIARTYICRQIEAAGEGDEIAESALDMDYLESDQLKKLWGSGRFPQYYQKLEDAVKATSGIVMTYEGRCIDPMYCRAAAGMTRMGDFTHPYLQIVDCPGDVEAEGYMQMVTFSKDEFAARINSIPQAASGPRRTEPSQIPGAVQIASRDEAGYVDEIQIGGYSYTGEEIQYALGLQSAAFSLDAYEEQIRATAKGIGHGYGLSQWTANQKAKEGWRAEDILGYFYKNIALLSE